MSGVAIFAYDPAVPHRDRLLDPDEMRSRLTARLSIARTPAVRTVRIKYRVGESARVVYRIGVGAQTWLVTARTFPEACRTRNFTRAHGHVVPCGAFPPVFEDADLNAVFWTFPNDRHLRGLEVLLAPAPELRSYVDGAWVNSRLVGYAPEKCAVAACLGQTKVPVAYAKLYSSAEDGVRAFRLHEAVVSVLGRATEAAVPRVIAYDRARRIMITEAAPGARLTDLAAPDRTRAVHMLGRAVARLHGADTPSGVPSRQRATPERLWRAARLIGRARPALLDQVEAVADDLIDGLRPARDAVLLHGDLHFKNALLDGDRLWMIDLDQVACGPAGADMGSFLALLRCQAIAGLISESVAETLAGCFLAGYATARSLPERRSLDWHTAAALIEERCVRAIGRMRAPLVRHLEAIIADARRLSRKAGGR